MCWNFLLSLIYRFDALEESGRHYIKNLYEIEIRKKNRSIPWLREQEAIAFFLSLVLWTTHQRHQEYLSFWMHKRLSQWDYWFLWWKHHRQLLIPTETLAAWLTWTLHSPKSKKKRSRSRLEKESKPSQVNILHICI